MRRSILRSTFVDFLLLLVLGSSLIKPLFRLEYLNNWPSIESTFIADARMLSEHLPHPGWQPLWYCGTRTDYIYPPALRYGTLLISRLAHVSPARGYHLYTAIFYVLGILAVYAMVRVGTDSRYPALLAALATALLSPSFLFLKLIRIDSGYWVPQRLHVLMAYGEGPHISALCVLPAALAATFLALRRWRPFALAMAGMLCALVVATNFYGATALAIFYPLMVWSVWVGERSPRVWLRAVAIPLLAYGLSAFWLTPSYIRITLIDLKWVSQPGNAWSMVAMTVVIGLYGAIGLRWGNRRAGREWPLFVIGSALILSLYVIGFYAFGFRVTGEPARLVPELDLAITLAAVELVRALWRRSRWHIPVTVAVIVAFSPAIRYCGTHDHLFPNQSHCKMLYEYKTAKWVHDHLAGERVLPSGTIRFWFDAWDDNAQPDGGSMQGMLNQNIPIATWQILHGDRADLAILWLQALGTDAVVVPDKDSPERYQDYQWPHKFRGVLPVLYDDAHGTVVYRIPRLHPGIVRVVDAAAIKNISRIVLADDRAALTSYVKTIEDPADPVGAITWHGFDEAEVQAHVKSGEIVLLQETWDPAWHAREGANELSIRPEPAMGFMLVDVPPGDHTVRMRFETPLENRLGQIAFVLTAIVLAGLFAVGKRRWVKVKTPDV